MSESKPTALPRLILDETADAGSGSTRDLERDLRMFHLRSTGDRGGAGFLPVSHREAADAPGGDPETEVLLRFLEAAQHRTEERREAFRLRVRELARRLQSLLEVDQAKRSSRSPDTLAGSLGSGVSDLLDASALAAQLGSWRGTSVLKPERRERLERVARQLKEFTWGDLPVGIVVRDQAGALPEEAEGWMQEVCGAPCSDAIAVFDEYAQRLADVFGAVRIATLEAAGRFDPERHGPWVEHLEPASYSTEERQLAPVVVAWDRAERVVDGEIAGFTRFLLSDRPVQLIVMTDGAPDAREDERLELGYLAVAHRKAFVQQSSLGVPEHLQEGMRRGLAHMRPALHVVLAAAPHASAAASEAALFARVHPLFRYDPQAGSSWGGRMDFDGNPAPEENWPPVTVDFDHADGRSDQLSVPFTPADWALLREEMQGEFRPLPPGYSNPLLTELGAYLQLAPGDAVEQIPFLWAAESSGRLRRLVVTRRLVLACRERLDFWHTLQELAGVRSEYVLEAVRQTREELESLAEAEMRKTTEAHAAELADSRKRAVDAAIQRLSQRLLDPNLSVPGDLTAGVEVAPAGSGATGDTSDPDASTAVAGPTAAPSEAAAAAEANGDAPVSPTPWIDSALCTSCNDCIGINSVLFVYDANKQATIGNPKGGTYAQMVRAAEKCPARCIHPGLPLNPEEPGLEKLVQRAQAYQ